MRLATPVRAESKGSRSRLCLLAFLYFFVRTSEYGEQGAKYASVFKDRDYCGPSAMAGADLCASVNHSLLGTTAMMRRQALSGACEESRTSSIHV